MSRLKYSKGGRNGGSAQRLLGSTISEVLQERIINLARGEPLQFLLQCHTFDFCRDLVTGRPHHCDCVELLFCITHLTTPLVASGSRSWGSRCASSRNCSLGFGDRRHPSTSKRACVGRAAPLVQSEQLVDLPPQLPTLRPDDCEATQLVWGEPLLVLARRISEVNHVRVQTCDTPLEIGHAAAGRREGSVTPHPLIEPTPALRVVAATARKHHVAQHRVAPESDGDEVVPSVDIGGATEDAFRRTRSEERDDGLHFRFSKTPRREALSNSMREDGESERRSHALRDSRKLHPHLIPVTRLSAQRSSFSRARHNLSLQPSSFQETEVSSPVEDDVVQQFDAYDFTRRLELCGDVDVALRRFRHHRWGDCGRQ